MLTGIDGIKLFLIIECEYKKNKKVEGPKKPVFPNNIWNYTPITYLTKQPLEFPPKSREIHKSFIKKIIIFIPDQYQHF